MKNKERAHSRYVNRLYLSLSIHICKNLPQLTKFTYQIIRKDKESAAKSVIRWSRQSNKRWFLDLVPLATGNNGQKLSAALFSFEELTWKLINESSRFILCISNYSSINGSWNEAIIWIDENNDVNTNIQSGLFKKKHHFWKDHPSFTCYYGRYAAIEMRQIFVLFTIVKERDHQVYIRKKLLGLWRDTSLIRNKKRYKYILLFAYAAFSYT